MEHSLHVRGYCGSRGAGPKQQRGGTCSRSPWPSVRQAGGRQAHESFQTRRALGQKLSVIEKAEGDGKEFLFIPNMNVNDFNSIFKKCP